MLESQIRTAGVINPAILEAFKNTPKERFVPESAAGIAYKDEEIVLGHGRYLLEPLVHAKMIEALSPSPQHVVLDVGCATGYSSAILSSLVTTVVALDNEQAFLEHADKVWQDLGACNIVSFLGALPEGQSKNAPYDLIVCNGALAEIPEKLVAQLASGGRMVCIIRPAGAHIGRVTLIESLGEKGFSSYTLFDAAGSYLPGFEPAPAFAF